MTGSKLCSNSGNGLEQQAKNKKKYIYKKLSSEHEIGKMLG
jgi:hypothetical protein